MNIRIPTPVPATPSASTEALASQPGSSAGACASPNGSERERRAEDRRRRERERVEPLGLALEQEARERVEAPTRPPRRACPTIAQASTSGCAPVSTPTPTSPRAIPTIRRPVARSLRASQIARMRDEERHGRVGDRRDSGVDVLLAPRDQRERQTRC